MKKIMIIAALAIFSTGIAQNTNENEVKTVKKTVITDNDGENVTSKTVKTKIKEDLALGKRVSNQNFNTIMSPATVTTDIDYNYNGLSYRFVPENKGYSIVDRKNDNVKVARLYPTSQKGYYIYTQEDTSSFGYFNADGDFVVESYDPDNDGVMNYVYKIKIDENTKNKMKKDKMKMKKDKMK
ncbi:hypothetical protein [Rasiella sp. SM2506]|uniref:hypothetical protein n=1 Tax=Rasiella sp. SM2506 TaxID=3423914 RepID=UPI003D7B5AC6